MFISSFDILIVGRNMNSQQEEIGVTYPSRRKRIGRVLFLVGIALIVIGLVSSLLISVVSAYSGSVPPTASFEYVRLFLVISGLLLVLAGLAAVLLPEGPSKDGLWVMKIGPLFGNS